MTDIAVVAIGAQPERVRAAAGNRAVEIVTAGFLGDIRDAALRAEAPFLWLLDSTATPSEGALDALVDHAHQPAVSLPVDDRDAPVEWLVGRFAEADLARLVDAVNDRRVPLRHTYVISMLIRREVVIEHAPPDPERFGRYAGSEWTARVFASTPGMLVPESKVRVGHLAPGSPRHAMRMACTGVWGRGETLRELHRSVLAASSVAALR